MSLFKATENEKKVPTNLFGGPTNSTEPTINSRTQLSTLFGNLSFRSFVNSSDLSGLFRNPIPTGPTINTSAQPSTLFVNLSSSNENRPDSSGLFRNLSENEVVSHPDAGGIFRNLLPNEVKPNPPSFLSSGLFKNIDASGQSLLRTAEIKRANVSRIDPLKFHRELNEINRSSSNIRSTGLPTLRFTQNFNTLHENFILSTNKDGCQVQAINFSMRLSDYSLEELRHADYKLIKNANSLSPRSKQKLEYRLREESRYMLGGMHQPVTPSSFFGNLGNRLPSYVLPSQNASEGQRPSLFDLPKPGTSLFLTRHTVLMSIPGRQSDSEVKTTVKDYEKFGSSKGANPKTQPVVPAAIQKPGKQELVVEEEENKQESKSDQVVRSPKEFSSPLAAENLTEEQKEALDKEITLKKEKKQEEERKSARENQVRRKEILQNQKALREQVLPSKVFLSYNNLVLKEERNFTVTYQATSIKDPNQHVIITALNFKLVSSTDDAEIRQRRYELFIQTTMQMLNFNHDLICPIISHGFKHATLKAYFVQPMYSKSLQDMIEKGENVDIIHLLTNLLSVAKYIESKEAVFGTLNPSTIYQHKGGNYCLSEIYYSNDIFICKKCLDMDTSTSVHSAEDELAAEEEKIAKKENEFNSENKAEMLLENKQLREIVFPDLDWSKTTITGTKDYEEVYSEKEIANIQRQQVGLLVLKVLGMSSTTEKFLLEHRVNAVNYRTFVSGVFFELLDARGLLHLLKPLAALLDLDSDIELCAGIQKVLDTKSLIR